MTPDQLFEFIEVWDSHELLKEYANYVVGLAYTGARPQELGALTWDDIDLQARTLDINKAIKTTHTGKQYVSNILKTESASRVLGIDEVLLARLRFRKTTNPSDTYVFSSSRGEMINLNNFRSRYWNKALMLSSVNTTRWPARCVASSSAGILRSLKRAGLATWITVAAGVLNRSLRPSWDNSWFQSPS